MRWTRAGDVGRQLTSPNVDEVLAEDPSGLGDQVVAGRCGGDLDVGDHAADPTLAGR
jgi:hypothetical protein